MSQDWLSWRSHDVGGFFSPSVGEGCFVESKINSRPNYTSSSSAEPGKETHQLNNNLLNIIKHSLDKRGKCSRILEEPSFVA